MNAKQFFDLVSQMREQQREYFRTHSPGALNESKRLERMVDAEIVRVNQILNNKNVQTEIDFKV